MTILTLDPANQSRGLNCYNCAGPGCGRTFDGVVILIHLEVVDLDRILKEGSISIDFAARGMYLD
jgi:hypothetical protein